MTRTLSTHMVEVVPVVLLKHPNADSLSIVVVYGYTCVVKTDLWTNKTIGAYVPPDSLVDTCREEFAFLGDGKSRWARIKAKKLRGVQSFGLLVAAPAGSHIGDDVTNALGVVHYDPPQPTSTYGEAIAAPRALAGLSKYDVDSIRRYPNILQDGEFVFVTEKIHGASARFCWCNDKLWVGSRTEWKLESASSIWWRAAETTPQIKLWCEQHPMLVLYGEVYGQVQDLKYGTKPGEVRFAAFDVYDINNGRWLDVIDGRQSLDRCGVPNVPWIDTVPYHFDKICALADGQSLVPNANNKREGCVVKPTTERWSEEIGRVQLKCVSGAYLNG